MPFNDLVNSPDSSGGSVDYQHKNPGNKKRTVSQQIIVYLEHLMTEIVNWQLFKWIMRRSKKKTDSFHKRRC